MKKTSRSWTRPLKLSTPCPKLIAIILAAGKGNRFGMPKIDALFRGKTFLDSILSTLKAAGLEDVYIARDLPTADMLSSLIHAVKSLDDCDAAGYLIFPVDHPCVQDNTVIALRDAFWLHPEAIIRPSFLGKRGHPIVIPKELDLLAEHASGGLAGIIRASQIPKMDLNVNDGGILENINYARQTEDDNYVP